MTRSNTVNG